MQKQFWIQLMKGFVFIVMMASPFFVAAQINSGKNAGLLVQADTLMNRQDYEGALSLYNKVLEKSKLVSDEDYKILYKRAFCYYGLGKFDDALKDVNQYLQKLPDDQAKLLRAYINQELGNFDAQLADLNEFIAGNPGNPDLLRWRASVLMEAERYSEAEKDIRSLLQVQPGPELKAYLGLIYYYQQNPDSALTIFDEVIAENPEYPQTYLYSASLALEEEAYDLALQYVNKGLARDPANLTLLFYKGIALVEKEDIDAGCRCLTKAFSGGMDDASDYLKAYCYGVE
ncbi:MAG: hypothetical protein C0490_13880 [Marivirga sp.]|nr:hypothetical protein [Marivirga sp.]